MNEPLIIKIQPAREVNYPHAVDVFIKHGARVTEGGLPLASLVLTEFRSTNLKWALHDIQTWVLENQKTL